MAQGVHKNPFGVYVRGPGLDPDLRDAARSAARQAGFSGLSEPTIRFWEWLAADPQAVLAMLNQAVLAMAEAAQP